MKTIFITLLMLPLIGFSQKQGNIWYFGGDYNAQSNPGAGLDFNSGTAVALTNSALPYSEGTAAYCNSGGQLLFYTNGVSIYDRSHNVMLNGDSLGGHWSSQQAALIVPVTGDTNKYFVFCNDGLATGNGTGLHYSLVDMTLNAGYGAVLNPKAINLISNNSEQLTGCRHANGIDFWVIATDYYSCEYFAFRVTPTAVMPPVISYPGMALFSNSGNIEISPIGNKIANKQFGGAGGRYLLDFDNATGIISNPYLISTANNFNSGGSFSPDGNLFYDIERTNTYQNLYQYDLNAPNIIASKTLITSIGPGLKLDMQRGPDGRIYIAGMASVFLDVINYPNLPGVACNFQANAVSLAGILSGSILPNELLIANTISGLNENANHSDIELYPNPFTDAFTIHNPAAVLTKLILRDPLSRIIMQLDFNTSATVNTDQLNKGIYFYELSTPAGLIKTGRIIKQ